VPPLAGPSPQAELKLDGELRLRPAAPEDRFRIHHWLATPDTELWWGARASAEAQITLAMGSAAGLCRIIEHGGDPIGYAQASEIGLWSEAWPKELPPGSWQVAVLLAAGPRQAERHQRALAAITHEVFATTLAVACVAAIPVTCEPAVRAYETEGFRWLRIWHDPLLGAVWLTLKERPPPTRQDH
jgi:hypothetical protein